jgi:hypothetical protein
MSSPKIKKGECYGQGAYLFPSVIDAADYARAIGCYPGARFILLAGHGGTGTAILIGEIWVGPSTVESVRRTNASTR